MDVATDMLALLRLQLEWGADEALDPAPLVRLRPAARAAASPGVARRASGTAAGTGGAGGGQAGFGPANRDADASGFGDHARGASPGFVGGTGAASPPRSTPAERALAAAAQAHTLEELNAAIAAFDGCALRDTASHPVLATGPLHAGVVLIGDAPGADEDRAGQPFSGAEGGLLDRMLGSIGLSRDGLLLAPLIPWRPPGGRPPNPAELAICLPFLHRLLALAVPHHVLVLGGLAARSLLGPAASRRRGLPDWIDVAVPGLSQPVPILALPALSALAKTPALRRDVWAGLRRLRRALDTEAGS